MEATLTVPEMIDAICRRLGITQDELAQRLGTYGPTISRWRQEHHPPHRLYRRELERLYTEALTKEEAPA